MTHGGTDDSSRDPLPDIRAAGDPDIRAAGDTAIRAAGDADTRAAGDHTATDVGIQQALAESLLDAIDHLVGVVAADGTLLAANQAWQQMGALNGAPWVPVGADYLGALQEAGAEVGPHLQAVLRGERSRWRGEYASGPAEARTHYRMMATRHLIDGRVVVVTRHEPRTRIHEDRSELAFRSALLDQVDVAVIATDTRGTITSWNAGAQRLFGWDVEEALGCDLVGLLVPAGREAQARLIGERVRASGHFEGQTDLCDRDGTTLTVEVRYRALETERVGMVLVAVDASQRLEMERRVVRANQRLRTITDRMREGLVTLDRAGRITSINPHGQELLGGADGRYLGGSFVNRLVGIRPDGSIPPRAEQLIGNDFSGALPTSPTEDVLLRADGSELAIEYLASPLGDDLADPGVAAGAEGWVVVFRDITTRRARDLEREQRAEHARWMEVIDDALRRDRFVLFAQPIVELDGRHVVRHELLLRLDDPVHGLLTPDRFLPTAERFGLATEIDRWVLQRGLALAATGAEVEMNLSARTVNDRTFADLIARELDRQDVDPGRVGFEVTETALLASHDDARRFAEQVRALGCRLALDDFGTGYGGLSYVKSLPVDTLKIDREFVRDVLVEPASQRVVAAVVGLADAFGLMTIAEGVEDEATARLLQQLGVGYGQGFLFGHPAPAADQLARSAAATAAAGSRHRALPSMVSASTAASASGMSASTAASASGMSASTGASAPLVPSSTGASSSLGDRTSDPEDGGHSDTVHSIV